MAAQQISRSSLATMAARHGERVSQGFAHRGGRVAFVENKPLDLDHVAELLAHCEACNQWANRGPLYWALAEAYQAHMNLPQDVAVTPCANGGVALEALARFHEIQSGDRLRWVGSAFSFSNLGRGWFTGMQLIDCDTRGMLDLAAVRALDPASYDGIVVTNIFGLWQDFGPYIEFARSSGKRMLIDNAAGIDKRVPDWPYQSFSLHHTKPYGAGEGGLLVSPRDEVEEIYALLNYGAIDRENPSHWLNNGKLSDIACAFHLDRLATFPQWGPRYREQAGRVQAIAIDLGLQPLVPGPLDRPATSRAFLADGEIPLERLLKSETLVFGKYYKPLASTPKAVEVFNRLVNIPTHPDVGRLSDTQLQRVIAQIMQPAIS